MVNSQISLEDPMNAQPTEPLPERLAYSVAEAVQLTGLSRDLLYDQMRHGTLAYLKVGRRRVITRTQLETFLSKAAS
jgi:excisionase family DNA binding protein